MTARIVIISGACGTGKSSVSRLLAETSAYEHAVHIHTDESAAACAQRFSEGGYEVYVDGVIGPWYLGPWINIAEKGTDVRYIVLRPEEQVTIDRAAAREQRAEFPLSSECIEEIWQSFSDLGEYEANAVDTTHHTVDESVLYIQRRLKEGAFRLR